MTLIQLFTLSQLTTILSFVGALITYFSCRQSYELHPTLSIQCLCVHLHVLYMNKLYIKTAKNARSVDLFYIQ